MSNVVEDLSRPHRHSQFQFQRIHSHPQSRNMYSPTSAQAFPLSLHQYQSADPAVSPSDQSNASTGSVAIGTYSTFAMLDSRQTYGDNDNVALVIGRAVASEPRMISNDSTASRASAKQNKKPKFQKHSKSRTQRSIDEPLDGQNPSTNGRYDSSLGFLTKKFVRLILEADDGTIDLNRAADVLKVQKRRIYDITNVLEGVGLIEKTTMNHIRWKACKGYGPQELNDQVNNLKAEVESLHAEERRLDDYIRMKQELLRTLEENEDQRKNLYVIEDDILQLPGFQDRTLIAVKAPQASYIEVLDPDEEACFSERQYRMIIKSSTGPIDLYLLRKGRGCEESPSKQAKPMDVDARPPTEQQSNTDMVTNDFCPPFKECHGIQRILPLHHNIDSDYWFQSNSQVSITHLWGEKHNY